MTHASKHRSLVQLITATTRTQPTKKNKYNGGYVEFRTFLQPQFFFLYRQMLEYNKLEKLYLERKQVRDRKKGKRSAHVECAVWGK